MDEEQNAMSVILDSWKKVADRDFNWNNEERSWLERQYDPVGAYDFFTQGKPLLTDTRKEIEQGLSHTANFLREQSQEKENTWNPLSYTDDVLRLAGGGAKNTAWAIDQLDKAGQDNSNISLLDSRVDQKIAYLAGNVLRATNFAAEKGADVAGWVAKETGWVDEKAARFVGALGADYLLTAGAGALAKGAVRGVNTLTKVDDLTRARQLSKVAASATPEVAYNMSIGLPGATRGVGIKNIPFTGTKRGALNLSGMSTGARKTAKQNFFTNIYDAGKSKQGLAASQYSRRYTFGGAAQIGGVQRKVFKMAPHHFTIDDDLAFMAANTADAPEFVRELHRFDIYPGNHPRNFIGAYHDNTKMGWNETKKAISDLWGGDPKAPTDRKIVDFLKMPSEGKLIGKGATLLEEIDLMAAARQQGLEKKDWSQILPKGKTVRDIKINPVVLGIDHQELIHGVVDNLQSRKDLIKLIESPKWLRLNPRQRAIEVAKVSRESQNVALHINKIRLEAIKAKMTELGVSTDSWLDIQYWMAKHPQQAASLNYHKLLSKGTGLTIDDLIKDLPEDVVKEVAWIFNLEAIPRTGEILDKLNKTSKTFRDL